MSEQDRYRERVRNAFEKFLSSSFIEYKPYSMDDDRIISDAEERSDINYNGGLLQWMQSFASIYTIEGAKELEWAGREFTSLFLKPHTGNAIRVNYTDFRYNNSFYTGDYDTYHWDYKYDESNARFVNLLDDKIIDPAALASHVGQQILVGYSFPTVNTFKKLRTCYRFYSLNDDGGNNANIIRKQILRAQAFALLLAAKYPVLCLPSYNFEHIESYMYDITKEIGSQYIQRLRIKLSEVERALNGHGLTYEHNF